MIPHVSRRGFLAASAALAATTALPRFARAGATPLALTATTRTIEVDGRAATVYGLVNAAGKSGLILDPSQRFQVALTNALDVQTLVHWHGQIPPNVQDGVPDMPMPKLKPGETRAYDFVPEVGTYWMHSHIAVQEMAMLAAPLIVRSAADVKADRQDVVMFLHDFSFKTPEEVLATITGGAAASDGMGQMAGSGGMSGMAGMAGMGGMAMDINDYDFDAYLANDRTLSDPEVVHVEKGGRIRLRVVNAAAATTFWIDTGAVEGRLVAVDGRDVQPLAGHRFGVAMAQRLDIELDLPGSGGRFPVLAQREGARDRTGLILASTGAKVQRIEAKAEEGAPAFDMNLAQESRLRAVNPLAARPVDKAEMVMLSGAMQPYVWTINGQTWENHVPVTARSGQRVELTFHNMSMMAHPMHLHGHTFQVVAIGGRRFAGAMRDTVLVPPMAAVTIALDAGEPARWMLHCHHIPHMASGMMTEFAVAA
ncbi:copper resistance protein A precursor [mine drainage metagenome]|uniref:Copper resistance protein A n=1 Tax=mine drainage metagenome TaxID=410659 RepID=A0A1J5Q480_9ZZZZ